MRSITAFRAFGVPGTITVVAAQFVPDEAIYLWAHGDSPVAYALPWDQPAAEQLQDMMRAAEGEGEMGVDLHLGYCGDDFVISEEVQQAPGKTDE